MTTEPPDGPGREERANEIIAAYLGAADAGQAPDREELLARHPDLADELRSFFADHDAAVRLATPTQGLHPTVSLAAEPAVEPATQLGSGRRFGDYELLDELGRGGMGVVYRARQVSLNRTVALKMIRAGQLAGEAEVQRFRAEAEHTASLDHPNIVPIYEVGEYSGQQLFSMKLIEGGSLDRHLVRYAADPCGSARLMLAVARAVHHAHQRGLLHRDLKPANILIDEEGNPHVTDFGLARRLGGAAGQTQSGAVVGTPEYMAPEQAAGRGKELTTATDVHGLGALLYALLTGQPPFRGADVMDTLQQVMQREPVSPRTLAAGVPPDLETVCLKCLRKDPAERYASAAALADDLERWLSGEPISARPVGRAERTWRWCRRHPATAGLVAALAALVVAVGLGSGFAILAVQAREAREWAEENEQRAEEKERQAHAARVDAEDQKARSDADRGLRSLEEGDPLGALPWLAEAVRKAQGQPERERVHRLRLAAVLRQSPRLLMLWRYQPGETTRTEISAEGTRALVYSGKGNEAVARLHDPLADRVVAGPWTVVGQWDKPDLREWNDAFSPDGRSFLTVEPAPRGQGLVVVRHTKAGEPLASLRPPQPVRRARFTPDGRRLVTLAAAANERGKHEARVWDVVTGREVPGAVEMDRAAYDVRFSGDGRLMALLFGGSLDVQAELAAGPFQGGFVASATNGPREVLVVEVASGRPVGPAHRLSDPREVRFTPDNRLLEVPFIQVNGVMPSRLWDPIRGVPGGPPFPMGTLMDDPWTYGPEGGHVVCVKSGTAAAWNPTTGVRGAGSWQWPGKERRHLLFSPDGRLSLTAQVLPETGRRARLWDWRTGRPTSAHLPLGPGDDPAQLFADGRRLLVRTARPDGTEVRLWDPLPPSPIRPLHPEMSPAQSWWTSPDGGLVAAFRRDPATGARQIRIHDTASGQVVGKPWDLGKGPSDNAVLAFSSGGSFVAVVVSAGDRFKDGWQLLVWDVAGGRAVGPACRLTDRADVRLTADGQRAVTRPRYGHGPTQLWDVAAGRPIRTLFDGKEKRPYQLVLSPDSRTVAGLAAGVVELWDARSGEPLRTIPLAFPWKAQDRRHFSGTDFFAEDQQLLEFSPDGERLAAAWSAGPAAWLCPIRAGDLVVLLPGQTDVNLRHLGFNHDGSRLVTVQADGDIWLWDGLTGQRRGRLSPPLATEIRDCVARFAKGKDLLAVAARGDGWAARVWDLRTGQAVTPRLPVASAPAFIDFGDGERAPLAPAGTPLDRLDVWPVGDDPRPTKELLRLAEVLSGQHVEGGAVVPSDFTDLHRTWQELHEGAPESFRLSGEELLAWHRHEVTACEEAGDWSAAVVHLSRLIAAEPAVAEQYVRRAGAYEHLRADETALRDYTDALARQNGQAPTWKRRGICNARLGRFDRAAADLTRSLEIAPRDAEAHFERGEVLARLQRWREAADDYRQAGDLDAKKWKPWQRRSLALAALGQQPEAEADFRKALKLRAPAAEACQADWQCKVALQELSAELARRPDSEDHLAARAALFYRLGRWDLAVQDYDRLLSGDGPIHGDQVQPLWRAWAGARARARGQDRPAPLFVRLAPPADGAWQQPLVLTNHRKACLRLAAGDEEGFRKLCARDAKEDWQTKTWYGPGRTACLAAGAVADWRPFIEQARASLKREPMPRKVGTLGALLYRGGSYKEAVEQLTEAVRMHDDGDGWSCLFLAMAHQRMKHDAEARHWLAQATAAREHLDKLRQLKLDRDRLEGLVGPTTAALDVPLLNLVAWWEWAELELLWPEAEALLGTRPAGAAAPGLR